MASEKLINKWIQKADNDFFYAKASIEGELEFFDLICFHFQQAAEKYLKTFIIKNKLEFRKAHDLQYLLNICKKHDNTFAQIKNECVILQRFYIEPRYPTAITYEYTRKDADEAQSAATKVRNFIRNKLVITNAKNIIVKAIPNVLKTVDVPGVGKKHSGKVRDFYFVNDKRILITTDRQSAFNYNLGYVPYKGAVLNLLSKFWFEKTKDIVPNHMLAVPDPNVMIVYNCKSIPIEMVVRGYITGVTTTSIWYSYKRGERTIYGIKFPDGLRKNEKLQRPIITPTKHPDAERKSHEDERLTREEIIEKGIVDENLYEQMEKAAFQLFEYGSQLCRQRGLILVDTKYEFGLYNGELKLIDEVHTPDSSRFWIADTYEDRFNQGLEPENFDKEFLRLRYRKELGYSGTGKPPEMSQDLVVDLAKRYIAVYEKITDKKFELFEYPIEERIKNSIAKFKINDI